MPAPPTTEAPRTAAEAAHLLARDGHHVHIVSDGHSTCLRGGCGPTPVALPETTRERARLTRLAMRVGINRL
ncbi:hypothetical protein SUDANB145_07176 (plasmid) [Streptomyces sp. enrichment culture]|uniref:hypothetical protein n=1 Tax=Streptomyces sp. enrichment culture TaxID=1795815 RepID=UPI003F54A56A